MAFKVAVLIRYSLESSSIVKRSCKLEIGGQNEDKTSWFISVRQVVIMGKVMILSFSEDEEEVCQRMLQIISESPRFEGCNVLQVEKHK